MKQHLRIHMIERREGGEGDYTAVFCFKMYMLAITRLSLGKANVWAWR